MRDMRTTLDACLCPRGVGEQLSAPRCKVVMDPGAGEDEGPVIVEMPEGLRCPMGRRLSYGEFCLDMNRIRLFRDFGI